MYTKTTTEPMSIDSKTSEAIDTEITATIALMKRCSVSDTTTNSETNTTPTIDMDVDTAASETAQISEKMEIDTATPAPERSDVQMLDCVPMPQHKRLALLAGGDARHRALSLQHKTLAPCIHRGRAQLAQRPSGLRGTAGQRQSRLASAAMQILEAVGDFALARDVVRDVEMGGGE
jgi:hypothetical protein